jgi:hypothetical protein
MDDRMTLQHFREVLQPYRESIKATDALLTDLSAHHHAGETLTIEERVGLLRALAALARVYDGCRGVVEATHAVPEVLPPTRLPLLAALIEAKEQALALARLVAALPGDPTRQDVTEWWETGQAIGALQGKHAAVAEEARYLLDQARFRERADQAEPRQTRSPSRQRGKRG